MKSRGESERREGEKICIWMKATDGAWGRSWWRMTDWKTNNQLTDWANGWGNECINQAVTQWIHQSISGRFWIQTSGLFTEVSYRDLSNAATRKKWDSKTIGRTITHKHLDFNLRWEKILSAFIPDVITGSKIWLWRKHDALNAAIWIFFLYQSPFKLMRALKKRDWSEGHVKGTTVTSLLSNVSCFSHTVIHDVNVTHQKKKPHKDKLAIWNESISSCQPADIRSFRV